MRDANDLQVGTFVGIHGFAHPLVLIDNGDDLVPIIVARNRLFGTFTSIYFGTVGCTGPGYTQIATWNEEVGTLSTSVVYSVPGGFKVYQLDAEAGPVIVNTRSYWNQDGVCLSENSNRSLYPLLPPLDLFFTAPFRLSREGS